MTFSKAGLARLKAGLSKAGLDAAFLRRGRPAGDPDRPPYRGLRPLEAEDAGIFFGREAPTIEALDRLRGLKRCGAAALPGYPRRVGGGQIVVPAGGPVPAACTRRPQLPAAADRAARAGRTGGETGLIRSLEAACKAHALKPTRAEVKAAVEAGGAEVGALLRGARRGSPLRRHLAARLHGDRRALSLPSTRRRSCSSAKGPTRPALSWISSAPSSRTKHRT